MANVFVRDELRTNVINTLISTFPGAQKVSGGVAFMSEVLDEETGKFKVFQLMKNGKIKSINFKNGAEESSFAINLFPGNPINGAANNQNLMKTYHCCKYFKYLQY